MKIGDRVKVIASEERLEEIDVPRVYSGKEGVVVWTHPDSKHISIDFSAVGEWEATTWNFDPQDLELIQGDEQCRSESENARTFATGATRDTTQGKLDYVRALSPIVLRRYVQYLDKHRLQSDGSYRSFDNWKKGIPQETYHSSNGRHFFDAWLLTEGYTAEDNHGPVDLEDALCAQLFNIQGRLHEILKERLNPDRTKPMPGGY